MKRITALLFSLLLLFSTQYTRADEGMWLLSLVHKVNMEKMKAMGLELSAEDIYSVNQSSLKDAVVALDRGSCTAELISGKGLLLTNHHCGYGEIQEHSTVKNDYLKDGFWAATHEDELPNPGKTATFLIRMEEVTDQVQAVLNDDMNEMVRGTKIQEVAKKIEAEATEGHEHLEASVLPFFEGNRFFLFVTKTYRDVRLVGAPPSSIGKFGGDTDNWMWPRHTGDFALFRIYAGPDGEPADYSTDNVPLEPKKFFKISLKGIDKGDFAMVMGYPGGTDRYMTSWGVEQTMELTNKTRIKLRTAKQKIMKEYMNSSDKIRIQYASKFSRSSNYWKYSIGQNKQLKALKVVDEKQALEAELRDWINAEEARKEKYGEALSIIETSYDKLREFNHFTNYFFEAVFSGAEIFRFAYMTQNRVSAIQNASKDDKEKAENELKESGKEFFKDYHKPLDKEVFAALMKIYREDVDSKYHPDFFTKVDEEYEGDFAKFADYVYEESMLVNEKAYMKFARKPKMKKLNDDPGMQLMQEMFTIYRNNGAANQATMMQQSKGKRLFVDALIQMQEDKAHYPDANSTMRLTYGKVGDYEPRDAVLYKHYTTLQGVMEKEDPTNDEFIVDEKLKELYENKDYGRYGEGDIMPVCFITDNDITGGNSGSPVLNSKGHLIGTAFDGNWEAMSGDIKFEDELQKCINVDIRYTLFVIDKFAGATHLVEEMEIVE